MNVGRFDINQLLFADDKVLMLNSDEKLCRLASEFGRVCERRMFIINVGKRSYEVLEVCRWRSNVCETKWRTIKGNGLFEVPGVASGSGWSMLKRCGTLNE